nr:unnamed protein product [Callosobruchus analis]
MAMIFCGYKNTESIIIITIENVCDSNLEITVKMIQCCDTSRSDRSECNLMNLIGGDMGTLYAKYIKNVTLIFPNLYLMNRKGTCDIQIQYQDENSKKSIVKQIEFKTMEGSEDEDSDKSKCPSADTDPASNCAPVDCVIKYSGEQSFFNLASNECEAIPECCYDPQNSLPDTGYSVYNNSCIDLNCSITTHDLHLLENNQAYVAEAVDVLPANKICHHGDVIDDGTCQCWFGWETTTNENEMYEPTVLQYHMCNIEKGSWNSMNRGKIKATGLIITQYKASRQCECLHGDDADLLKDILVCENNPCNECICKNVFDNTIRSKTTVHEDGFMARSNSRKSIEFYPGGMLDEQNIFGDRSANVRSSATDSAEISFPTDTDETTQVSTDMEGEEDEYELSTSCRCYEHEEGGCTCDDSEDYTPSVHASKTPTSKSKTSSS